MKKLLILTIVCIITFSCKKKDSLSSATIHGQVYNLCTDSGMANITVYLKENENTIAQLNSDANGNFSFSNAQIHSSNDYSYSLYIVSKSGIGNGPEVGFDAGEWDVDKSKLSTQFTLGVVPHLKAWMLYFPSNKHITVYDTFTVTLQQNIYKKHFPNGVYQVIIPFPPPPLPQYPANSIGGVSNYCMGLWKVTLDKINNGVHIITADSFYVGYGAMVADTMPW